MRSSHRIAFVAALAIAVAAPRPPARADQDATEKRLKALGVDDAFRERVHASIESGVAFLGKRQRKDGAFRESTVGDAANGLRDREVGVTLLCALALRHAGTSSASAAVGRAVDWAFTDRPGSGQRVMDDSVYDASLALMLVAAIPGREADARRLTGFLVEAQGRASGLWSYSGGYQASEPEPDPYEGDLSNSQFAMLGLLAASRQGIRVPDEVWRRHAESLCRTQTPGGSWRYCIERPAPPPKPGAKAPPPPPPSEGTPSWTVMGAADLWIAKAALEQAKTMPVNLAPRVAAASARARTALERDGAEILSSLPPHGAVYRRAVGWDDYYSLFGLQKACVLGDVGTIDSRPWTWYAKGADWLMSVQHKDGGWDPSENVKAGRGSEVDTSLALLFLELSVSVFHTTTPTDSDSPPPPPPAPGAPPVPGGTPKPPAGGPPAPTPTPTPSMGGQMTVHDSVTPTDSIAGGLGFPPHR